ncbi:MAG: tandem-95 repeat protein [Candidatus Thermoplasmatota archaeon]|nr:tandem-95 repeat protein [Candidatus Thermoplasmatota archaeon]
MDAASRRALAFITIIAFLLPSTTMFDTNAEEGVLEITPIDDPELPPWGFYKGILPTTETGGDLAMTYANASKFTQFVPVWGRPSPFYNLSTDLEGSWGELFVDGLIRENNMFPLVHMNFHGTGMTLVTPPTLPSATLSDPTWRALYIQSAKDIVNASRPSYLSIGNEVNRWFEQYGMGASDNGFQHYISLYNETYDAVKALSPETKVFCTFSRENVAENREANLSILEHFDPDRMDVLTFTTYPFSVSGINRVSDMDNDYYSRVFLHFEDKPFALSEAAWSADPAFGGELEQSRFVSSLFNRFTAEEDLDVEFLGWNWLHDLAPADRTGLVDLAGSERTALRTWINNTEPTYDRNNRTIDLLEDFGTFIYPLNRTFSDPDPWDSLNYTIWNGTDYTDHTESKVKAEIVGTDLHLTSKPDINGVCQLRMQVEDWSGLTNWTFIRVRLENVNDAPREIVGFPDPHRFAEGQSSYINLSYFIRDPDDDFFSLTGKVTGAPNLVTSMNLSSSPYLVLYTEWEDWFGNSYVNMTISDPDGAVLEINLSISITSVNDAPEETAPSVITMEEDTSMEIDLGEWFSDPDGDELIFTIEISCGSCISMELNGSLFTLEPSPNWYGNAYLSINVSDGTDQIVTGITVEVSPVNDAPQMIPILLLNMTEDQDIYLPLEDLHPSDQEGDQLFWSISSISDELWSVSLPSNDTIHIRPSVDRFGTANFTISLEDGRGGRTGSTVLIDIEPVNDPPLLNVPPNWTTEIVKGSYREIDLCGIHYLVDDIDNEPDTLVAFSEYELIEIDGLLLNISIPSDISSPDLTIWIGVKDPNGGTSQEHPLLIIVKEEIKANLLMIDNITVTVKDGKVSIMAMGEPYQAIWAVIIGDVGIIGSFRMDETPPGSGNYELNLDSLESEDGIPMMVHLSSEEGGDNDSDLPSSPFTYRKPIKEEGNGEMPILPILIIIILIVIALIIAIWIRSSGKNTVSHFDYKTLMEE